MLTEQDRQEIKFICDNNSLSFDIDDPVNRSYIIEKLDEIIMYSYKILDLHKVTQKNFIGPGVTDDILQNAEYQKERQAEIDRLQSIRLKLRAYSA